jgi:TfoX/Sxy family transcriptional regulator of competence genes
MDTRQRFEALVTELADRPGVTPPSGGRGFGGSGLKVNGSIFAMVDVWGRFVVKLPADRVTALVAEGAGSPFDNAKGRVMKQWVVVDDPTRERELAEEALAFVGGR